MESPIPVQRQEAWRVAVVLPERLLRRGERDKRRARRFAVYLKDGLVFPVRRRSGRDAGQNELEVTERTEGSACWSCTLAPLEFNLHNVRLAWRFSRPPASAPVLKTEGHAEGIPRVRANLCWETNYWRRRRMSSPASPRATKDSVAGSGMGVKIRVRVGESRITSPPAVKYMGLVTS